MNYNFFEFNIMDDNDDTGDITNEEIYKLLMNKEFYQYYDANRSLPQDKKAVKYLKLNSYQSICKNYMNPKLNNKRLLLMHQPGCHKRGTKIYMHDYSVKCVEDIALGDKLLGDDLKPRLVTTLCRGFGKMYKIEYGGGIGEFTCNEDHILTVIIDKVYITDVSIKRLLESFPLSSSLWSISNMELLRAHCDDASIEDFVALKKSARYDAQTMTYSIQYSAHAVTILNQNNAYYRISRVIGVIYFNDLILARTLPFTISLADVPEDDYYGFKLMRSENVECNGRYVLHEHYIVTHNSGKTITAIATAQQYVEIYKNIHDAASVKLPANRDSINYLDAITPSVFVFGVSGTIVAFIRDMLKYPEFGYITAKEKAELLEMSPQTAREKISTFKRRILYKNKGGFYKFYGYQMFVNRIFSSSTIKLTEIETLAKRENKTVEELMQEYIDKGDIKINVDFLQRFKDSFVICDEFHHLYNSISKNNYGVAIYYLLKMVPSIRCLFLSATPINNNPAEFCDMSDFLNEKKTPRSELFYNVWHLRENAEDKIRDLMRGKISFVQDDNPELFPTVTFVGEGTRNHIPYLKFIECPMSEIHQIALNQLIANSEPSESSAQAQNVDAADDAFEPADEGAALSAYSFHKIPIVAFAIYDGVFPSSDSPDAKILYRSTDLKTITSGESAFVNTIRSGDIAILNGLFMKSGTIGKYSTKMQRILDDVMKIIRRKKVHGEKIMIYNDRVRNYGVLFIQQMLKQNGFLDEDSNPVEDTICVTCGDTLGAHAAHDHAFKPARFLMAHSNMEKARMELNRDKYNSISNLYGDEYLIFVGSKIIKESFDFRCVRHFIIFNGTTNISSMLQVFGRCSRKNSHIELPLRERTLQIYIYLTMVNLDVPHLETKSPEELKYEFKMQVYKEVQKTQKPMHEVAIDAALIRDIIMPENLQRLYFPRGKEQPVIEQLGELYFEPELKLPKNVIPDSTTYNAYGFYKEEIRLMTYLVKTLFMQCPVWTYDRLWQALHEPQFNIEVNTKTFSEDNFIIVMHNLTYKQNVQIVDNKPAGASATANATATVHEDEIDAIYSMFSSTDQIFYIGEKKHHILQVANYFIACLYDAGQMNSIDVETYIRSAHKNEVPRVSLNDIVRRDIDNAESMIVYNKVLDAYLKKLDTFSFERLLIEVPSYFQKYVLDKCILEWSDSTGDLKAFYNALLSFYDDFGVIIYAKEAKIYRDVTRIYTFIEKMDRSAPIGYVTAKNIHIYDFENAVWVDLNKITMNRQIAYRDNAIMVGFIEDGRNGDVKFKIKSAHESGPRDKDKRKIFRGEVCSTCKKPELIAYMRKLGLRENAKRVTDICAKILKTLLTLEIKERKKDTKIKYFYGWWNEKI